MLAVTQHAELDEMFVQVKLMFPCNRPHTSSRRNAWALTPWMFLVQDAPAAPAKTKAMSVTSPWHCELQALD